MQWKIGLAFFAVYLCWGMTYLAMRVAVVDIPPHLMSGAGFTSIAKAGTYAYVNPIVAVLLGWAILDETVTTRMLVAAAIILVGVALVSVDWSATGLLARLPARLRPTRNL
jgi:drug/metabolite transporter (DMT)-like permease